MDIRRRAQIGGIKKTSPGGDDVIPEPIINIDNYLTIEALENGLTASLSTNACEYCVDGDGNWKTLSANTATESINSGQTLSFRGELTPITAGVGQGIGTFTINKKCNLKGNCMSMLFGDNAANNYSLSDKRSAFVNLFYNCTNIVNVSSGFLPATTLASWCYSMMFQDCISLTRAPVLPATTLADSCYCNMFRGCSKLNYIKMLATDISASNCLYNWVNGVASTGTFVKNPAMTSLPTGVHGIPSGWTVVNDGEESGGNLITFYVADSISPRPNFIECVATEGMTWGEWIDSEYNTLDMYIDGDYVKTSDGMCLTSSSDSS